MSTTHEQARALLRDWQAEDAGQHADALAEEVIRLRAEVEALKDEDRRFEEREAACCPEDVGFEEWIAVLNLQNEAARAEVTALREQMAWQPIETAPKDRGFQLVYNADRRVYGLACWWPGGGWNGEGCWGWDHETIAWSRQHGNQPTHWKPLEPPLLTAQPTDQEPV